jgi:hypothetical protein
MKEYQKIISPNNCNFFLNEYKTIVYINFLYLRFVIRRNTK